MIGGLKAQRILILADACFAGDFLNVSRGASPTIDNAYFKKALQLVARQVLTFGASETVPDQSEFGNELAGILERSTEALLDPLTIFDRLRLGVSRTLPLYGTLPGNEQGSSFVLFLKIAIAQPAPSGQAASPAPAATVAAASPTGRIALPWILAGSKVMLGNGMLVSNEARGAAFRSKPLPIGDYALSVGAIYSGTVSARPDTEATPGDYIATVKSSLEAERASDAKRLTSVKTRRSLGWTSLGAGILGAAGAGTSYLVATRALSVYNGASTNASARSAWSSYSACNLIFPIAAAIGGVGLGLSPLLLIGRDSPATLQHSMDLLDASIAELQK